MPVVPTPSRMRQENHEFEGNLGYTENLSQKTNQKKKKSEKGT
jgi:hypothetical protein